VIEEGRQGKRRGMEREGGKGWKERELGKSPPPDNFSRSGFPFAPHKRLRRELRSCAESRTFARGEGKVEKRLQGNLSA